MSWESVVHDQARQIDTAQPGKDRLVRGGRDRLGLRLQRDRDGAELPTGAEELVELRQCREVVGVEQRVISTTTHTTTAACTACA